MTNGELPGLVGRTMNHLSGLPGVDTGLALGGALDVMAVVAGARYVAPTVAAAPEWDGFVWLHYINPRVMLVGSEHDCQRPVEVSEALLAETVRDIPSVGPAWPGTKPEPSRKSRLACWTRPERPFSVPAPGSTLDGPLLVGSSGSGAAVGGMADGGDE
jgi:hypothetical protein